MLTLQEVNAKGAATGMAKLADCAKLSRTLLFRRKVDASLRRLDAFFSVTGNPVVSFGGGKDSTALAILARMAEPSVLLVCADPPNPLPDREGHVLNVAGWLGGRCVRVPYPWDVDAVLDGRKRYPEGLKMRVLTKWHRENGIDGVALGVRAQESGQRKLVLGIRGPVYRVKTGWRCCPLSDWTAEETIALALMQDAPVNPVYTKQDGTLDFNRIHDGTWWPHGLGDSYGWLRRWYPDFAELYRRASVVQAGKISPVCSW